MNSITYIFDDEKSHVQNLNQKISIMSMKTKEINPQTDIDFLLSFFQCSPMQ